MELDRRRVQTLAQAMAIAKSLIEFKKDEGSTDRGRGETMALVGEITRTQQRKNRDFIKGKGSKRIHGGEISSLASYVMNHMECNIVRDGLSSRSR